MSATGTTRTLSVLPRVSGPFPTADLRHLTALSDGASAASLVLVGASPHRRPAPKPRIAFSARGASVLARGHRRDEIALAGEGGSHEATRLRCGHRWCGGDVA